MNTRKKKRILAYLLLMVMLISHLVGADTIELKAAILEDVEVSDIQSYASGYLKSFVLSYTVGKNQGRSIGAANARVSVQTQSFRDSYTAEEESNYSYQKYGDFSNYGKYAAEHDYSTWPESPADCGFIAWNSGGTFVRPATGNSSSVTISFEDGVIDLAKTDQYYMYIWANYSGKTYPDELVFQFLTGNGEFSFHTHSWSYTATDNQIKAYCQNTNASKLCNYQGEANAVSITLNAEDANASDIIIYYDKASISDTTAWEKAGLSTPTIKYEGTGDTIYEESFWGAPETVGTYKAIITVGNVTIEDEFTIYPATYAITVYNGTSDKSAYAEGEEVTITANTPAEGMQFKEWTVDRGNAVLASTGSAETVFLMPGEAVEVTATYEATPTAEPTPTEEPMPTEEPTSAPNPPIVEPEPTEEPTPEPTEEPTSAPNPPIVEPEPTEEPTSAPNPPVVIPEPTEEPTSAPNPPIVEPEPTEEPTPEPTEEPTSAPNPPVVIPEPTEEPTSAPNQPVVIPEPTEEPTPEPTEEPTPEPTAEPTKAEVPEEEKAAGSFVNDTRKGENAYTADLAGTEKILIQKILTEAERVQYAAEDIHVYLVATDITDTVSAEDEELTEEAMAAVSESTGVKLGVYLDLTLFRRIGNAEPEKLTSTNGAVQVTFIMPEQLINKDKAVTRSYYIIRIHEGMTEVLECFFDETTGMVSFETDAFSTYALVYTDEKTEEEALPKTGVAAAGWFILSGSILMLGGAGLLAEKKKRSVR